MVWVTCQFTLLRRQRLRFLASSFVPGPPPANILRSVHWLQRYANDFSFFFESGVFAALALLLAINVSLHAQGPFGSPNENSAFSIPQAQLIQPDELNRLLHAGGADKPLVLQVGSRVLFDEAHIEGSGNAGPGSQSAGLQLLQTRVAPLPRNTLIVLYCGCCPWNRCPNIAPAIRTLHSLGFTRVKALYLANNFGADWADKGFPVDRAASKGPGQMGAHTWGRNFDLAALVVAFCCISVSFRAFAADSLINKKAPQLVRMDLSGARIDLAKLHGKVVLLDFWATWCAPCEVEMPTFASWQRQFGPQGLRVVGVSMDDDPAPVRRLVAELKLNYPVAMGDAPLGNRFGGVLGLPLILIIDRNGIVRAQFQGETDLKDIEKRLKEILAYR